jgi:hypothetical protein
LACFFDGFADTLLVARDDARIGRPVGIVPSGMDVRYVAALRVFFNPLRAPREKARHPRVAEPEADRLRILEQVRRAAEALAMGRDGTSMAPPEIRDQVVRWRQQLQSCGQELDHERWLIGLMTLACLSVSPGSGPASTNK